MLHNKLLRVIQAHLVGFSTNIVLSCKRFCLFCLFRTSLSFAGCLVQLVSTYFPNRVIYRAHRRFIGLGSASSTHCRLIKVTDKHWEPSSSLSSLILSRILHPCVAPL